MPPDEHTEGDCGGRVTVIARRWVRQAWPLLSTVALVGVLRLTVATAPPEFDPDSWRYACLVLFPYLLAFCFLAGVIKFVRYCGRPNWREVGLGLVSNVLFFALLVGYFAIVCIQLFSSWLHP